MRGIDAEEDDADAAVVPIALEAVLDGALKTDATVNFVEIKTHGGSHNTRALWPSGIG